MDKKQKLNQFLEQRYLDLRKKIHGDAEPTEFQEQMLRMFARMKDTEKGNPSVFYTPEADILKVYTSEENVGQEFVKYIGPWKEGGGQGQAIELIMLKHGNGEEQVVGFSIWGITELLQAAIEESKKPAECFTEEDFSDDDEGNPPGWDGEIPPENPLDYPPGWFGIDGWRN